MCSIFVHAKPVALLLTTEHDERTLLNLLAQGDQDALTVIYRTHWQALFLSAYHVLKDKKACEDIVQELFLQLWAKRETLDVRTSLKTYLSAAVRYQVFHYLRKAAKGPVLTKNLEATLPAQPSDEILYQKEIRGKVAHVVEHLPEKCRLIYRLSREEHLSHKEIAERLNISSKTVENQLTIALRRLRHCLEEYSIVSLVLFFSLFTS